MAEKTRCNLLEDRNKSNFAKAEIFWKRTVDNKSRKMT